MRVWLLFNGVNYSDGGCLNKGFKTKKEAVKWIRSQGYKYNKSQDLYLNEDIDNGNGTYGQWIRIEEMEFIDG